MATSNNEQDGRTGTQATTPRAKDRRSRDPNDWIHRPIDRYRRRKRLAYRPDPEFFELADPVVITERTLLGYDRLYVFWQAIHNVISLPGAAVEIGSYRGGSAYFIASSFLALSGEEARLLVFDTFEGHPPNTITERDPFHTVGQFGNTSVEDVKAYLSPFRQLTVHQRAVSAESLAALEDTTYRLVHIDTDLYQPTVDCLRYFTPRLVSGGVVIVDDYAAKKCPGVAEATTQFLAESDAYQAWDMRTEQLMLVRR